MPTAIRPSASRPGGLATRNYASRNGYWDNACAMGRGEKLGEGCTGGISGDDHRKAPLQERFPETGFVDQQIPLNIKNGVGDICRAIRDGEITRYQFRTPSLPRRGQSDYIAYDREVARRAPEIPLCAEERKVKSRLCSMWAL